MKPRFLWLCLCLLALLFSHGSGSARPERLLKGVKIIRYKIIIEKTVGGEQCQIDLKGFSTALQFVASQSTKLKIITDDEQLRRMEKLNDAQDQLFEQLKASGKLADTSAEYLAAKKASTENTFMPYLFIAITPLELPSGCGGIVESRLQAVLDSSKMLATDRHVPHPAIEIWSTEYVFVSPKQMFADYATRNAEMEMKELVNDWSASQDLQ
jgi:hypothetical protein